MTGFLFNIVNLDPNNVSRGIHIGMRFARQMAREGLQMRKGGPNDEFGALYHPELNREDEAAIETVPIPAMRGNATWSILEFVFYQSTSTTAYGLLTDFCRTTANISVVLGNHRGGWLLRCITPILWRMLRTRYGLWCGVLTFSQLTRLRCGYD